jgi:hypothetical protein
MTNHGSDSQTQIKIHKKCDKDQKVQSYLSNMPDYKESKKKYGHLLKKKETQYAIPWKRDDKKCASPYVYKVHFNATLNLKKTIG